ncbi:MAG: hypothetical protein M5T61_04655 [Acidimicrobiia bacterium]|nr:hypothetical protein [Acidimicrobiia bacterium]
MIIGGRVRAVTLARMAATRFARDPRPRLTPSREIAVYVESTTEDARNRRELGCRRDCDHMADDVASAPRVAERLNLELLVGE